MSDTSNFFDEKKEWSKVKDALLAVYLRPYAEKLFASGRPIVYVDGFAGRGYFGNKDAIQHFDVKQDHIPDNLGSPFIAMKSLEWARQDSRNASCNYEAVFIEKKYADELDEVIMASQFAQRCKVYKGSFKDRLSEIIDSMNEKYPCGYNLFCYVDPFGIKDLDIKVLRDAARRHGGTTEFLINFNSFGALRAAIAMCGETARIGREIEAICEELGYENPYEDLLAENFSGQDNIMNRLFGSQEWQGIVKDYTSKVYDGYEAESRFSALYKDRLKKTLGFKYVLDMPIRYGADNSHPKYRMVYATAHPDGACIMGQNMRGRKELLSRVRSGGQLSLFDETAIEAEKRIQETKNNVMSLLESQWTGARQLEASLYDKYGICIDSFARVLKDMDQEGLIDISRDPAETKTGRKSNFYTESKRNKLSIRKKSN